MNTPSIGPIIKDDEIDLVALVKTIWAGRKIIYYSVGIAILIGLVIAFTSPVKYSASATLLPSAEKKGGGLGNLSALAGMAGINLGGIMGSSSGIPAELYPQVIGSYPFLNELIHQKFHFTKYAEPRTYYDYRMSDTIQSVGARIKRYTIGLPWTLKNAIFSGNKGEAVKTIDYGVLNPSEEELGVLMAAQGMLSADVDKKSGLVIIAAEASEPVLAAQYVQKAVDLLQKYVIDYKTQQARQSLDFVQQRFEEKKLEYEHAQLAFFDFKDGHRNMVSERVDLEYQRLSDAYDMASAVYKGLAQQLEQARIAVKEETPVFSVLEPVKVPLEKSAPKKSMILMVSIFLGGFLGLVWIFGRLVWENFKAKN
ncbi:MAG: Wzz/FepE/Etk N-terminal domain-containing protein [Breznakibacter sp.]